MADLIEKIGPYLGIAAFLGLAVLAFLIFQQAREVRRLREWAGRAPERKDEAGEAVAAAAEARGEEVEPEEEAELEPGRLGLWWQDQRDRVAGVYGELDRHSPVDPRLILALLAAGLIAALVLTGGFGLVGGGDGGGGGGGGKHHGGNGEPKKVEVAVLNATQEESVSGGEIAGVQGLAGVVADQVVKPAGFEPGKESDATSGFATTTIMYEPGSEDVANELAKAVADQLGATDVAPMIDEVRALAGGAPVALVIGRDDADFASSGGSGSTAG